MERFILGSPMSSVRALGHWKRAILQMNMLGHRFYMFLNAETGKVNVVYKRNEEGYGVLIPEIDG